ncbi:LytTR family DNA-binding domain-containing protein [Caulobacter mirabilis]|uniref:HTH LytTR-type domain-containing protein n=1 Tax=Caulobacter mirabilis TaxID=69666 RepID=A0A2D2B4C9_9CAUL|nr:LytTR family DNA-binding domain-containing protein [Caulobacter mirabilis]ATQ45130.1 hypothetical protein CSW64_19940 [Caulobacter mirabilis]
MRDKPTAIRETTGGAVRASWMTTSLARRHWRGLAIAVAAGVFMAVVGAFGTGPAPFSWRLGYWIVIMLIGGAGGVVVSELVDRGGLFDDRPVLQGVVIATGLTIPLTLIIWFVTRGLFHAGPMEIAHLPYFLGPTFIVTAVMTALNYLAEREPAATHAAPAGAAPPRFLDRLPLKLRSAELYAVEAEDHYLRLHTSKGQDLILMRLSDAVAELEGLEGAQVHRSWWVAKGAVADAKRGDGRATLTLTDGAQVPVSRAYAKALREAGWF